MKTLKKYSIKKPKSLFNKIKEKHQEKSIKKIKLKINIFNEKMKGNRSTYRGKIHPEAASLYSKQFFHGCTRFGCCFEQKTQIATKRVFVPYVFGAPFPKGTHAELPLPAPFAKRNCWQSISQRLHVSRTFLTGILFHHPFPKGCFSFVVCAILFSKALSLKGIIPVHPEVPSQSCLWLVTNVAGFDTWAQP